MAVELYRMCKPELGIFAAFKTQNVLTFKCATIIWVCMLCWWKWLPSRVTTCTGGSLMDLARLRHARCSPRHCGDLSCPINSSVKPQHEIS